MRGLIIARVGPQTEVWLPEQQRVFFGTPRGKLIKQGERIYAGDWVEVRPVAPNEVAIDTVLERKNLMPQPPIANVDKMVVIMSWHEPDFSNLVLDGLLAGAEFFEVDAVVVINKIDLVRKRERSRLESWVELYESLSYPVLRVSAKTGEGLEQLWDVIRGNIVVLSGPSGVGKSSILNLLIPGFQLKTREVSEKTGRGRHVTAGVRLLLNPQGGWVADTPGFTRVNLPKWVAAETLPLLYREFQRSERCAFNNCIHSNEPDCGVKLAVAEGRISQERYRTYLYWLNAAQQA